MKGTRSVHMFDVCICQVKPNTGLAGNCLVSPQIYLVRSICFLLQSKGFVKIPSDITKSFITLALSENVHHVQDSPVKLSIKTWYTVCPKFDDLSYY